MRPLLDMFRHRTRPDFPPLDEATAERMLDGEPVDAASDSHLRVLELLGILSRPAAPEELEGAAAAAATFVTAHDAATRPVRRTRPVVVLAVTTTLLALSAGTAVAATEGVLPEPVQAVAHDALGVVGISVPGITTQHPASVTVGGVPANGSPVVTSGDGSGTGNPLDPLGVVSGTSSIRSTGVTTPAAGDKAPTESGDKATDGTKGDHATEDPATPDAGRGEPKADNPEPKTPPEPKPEPEP
ncbi:MAG TPA: hypothetical protein VGN51_18365, partial [Acidimicrobiia bacterium]